MRTVAVLLAVLMVPACAGPNGEPAPDGTGGVEGAEGVENAMRGDVAATVQVQVQNGAVHFQLHVTNTGDDAIPFTFPSSQRYDFIVRTADGEPVWQWSDGMMFAQVISEATLAPGETWDFEAVWEPGDLAGVFQVVGEVTASERDVRQRMTFELP